MQAQESPPVPRCYCFRCAAGCVHLVLGNMTLTLTPREFALLDDAVHAMRSELEEEMRSARSAADASSTLLPM